MNSEIQPAPLPQAPEHVLRSMPRALAFIGKTIVAVLCIQSFVFALVLLGCLWRLTQRFVLAAWWKRSRQTSFHAFVTADNTTAAHQSWPNFFVSSAPRTNLAKKLFGGLWQNICIGIQAAFNSAVVLGPASALWIFSWYDGWNNSFNKGYEQAAVGPATGIAGVILFIAGMFYLPLAQTRQAATGDWRAFYQFRLVWTLIRRRWLECLGLSLLISALSLPLMVLKTAPGMFTAMKTDKSAPAQNGFRKMIGGDWENLSRQQALQKLNIYYLLCGLYLLPALVLTRWMASRVYASAIIDCVQTGIIAEDQLHEFEWRALNRLDLLRIRPQRRRNRFIRAVAWVSTKAGGITVGFAVFLVYFSLVAQVYVGEFLHKNDRALGWWNQPLIQIPYFNYTPARLRADAESL